VDVYENRLVRSFLGQVERRLRRLSNALATVGSTSLREEACELIAVLQGARQRASFLEDVGELTAPPDRVSMVLLRRPEYRSALQAFLRFQQGQSIRIDDSALDAPLEQLPYLYQLWCTLHVIERLLTVAAELGYRVIVEGLIGRDTGGYYVRPLPDGRPAVELLHPPSERRVRLVPERTYAPAKPPTTDLHSVSFAQRPDIAIEVTDRVTGVSIIVFDPKYKLDGENAGTAGGESGPLKVDIDKMHAYRDAIRGASDRHVVSLAAILYPGKPVAFRGGVEAIGALPSQHGHWLGRVTDVLRSALT
jgi:predicted component of viral defense system (DUF524 family)